MDRPVRLTVSDARPPDSANIPMRLFLSNTADACTLELLGSCSASIRLSTDGGGRDCEAMFSCSRLLPGVWMFKETVRLLRRQNFCVSSPPEVAGMIAPSLHLQMETNGGGRTTDVNSFRTRNCSISLRSPSILIRRNCRRPALRRRYMRFVVGLGIGVALGLLYAPAPGEVNRNWLMRKAGELSNLPARKLQQVAEAGKEKAGDLGARIGRQAAEAAVQSVEDKFTAQGKTA